MKTKMLIISLIFIGISSCKNNIEKPLDEVPNTEIVCGTKDPLNDLKWLSDRMTLIGGGLNTEKLNGVVLFEYKGDKIIEVQCGVCSSSNIHQYYCDGTKLDFVSTPEEYKKYKDYILNRKEIRILYGTKVPTFYPTF